MTNMPIIVINRVLSQQARPMLYFPYLPMFNSLIDVPINILIHCNINFLIRQKLFILLIMFI